MVNNALTVATLIAALGFIALGYAVDTGSDRFAAFRRFRLQAEAYWALGFWLFFALSVQREGGPFWLSMLNGFIALGATLHYLYDLVKGRHANKDEEPT